MLASIYAWFEPLLWVIGIITAFVAFIKLCGPAVKSLGELSKLQTVIEENTKTVKELKTNIEKIEDIQLALLHDAIIQIHHNAKRHGLEEGDYRRACELYSQNGHSPYIDGLMDELQELHKGLN